MKDIEVEMRQVKRKKDETRRRIRRRGGRGTSTGDLKFCGKCICKHLANEFVNIRHIVQGQGQRQGKD